MSKMNAAKNNTMINPEDVVILLIDHQTGLFKNSGPFLNMPLQTIKFR